MRNGTNGARLVGLGKFSIISIIHVSIVIQFQLKGLCNRKKEELFYNFSQDHVLIGIVLTLRI